MTPNRLRVFLSRTSPSAMLGVVGLLLLAMCLTLPLPYVVLKPGLTADTLGTVEQSSEPLIAITGTQTYPTDGALRLTTVRVQGQPGRTPSLVNVQWFEGRLYVGGALLGWLDSSSAVRPIADVYPPNQTAEQAEQFNRAEMVESQANAKAAAMHFLKVPPTAVVIEQVLPNTPAAGKLEVGDAVLSVDGTPVRAARDVRDAVVRRAAGEPIHLRVRRASQGGSPEEMSVEVIGARSSEAAEARTFIGVVPAERYPFDVAIKLDDVGGPSAGLMFALGIVDKLTPGSLTNGNIVAGTGEIDAEGTVGAIGGIPQKLAAARDEGATVFLTPALNCPLASRTVPDGLRLVKVNTLAEAHAALESLRTGQGDVPSC